MNAKVYCDGTRIRCLHEIKLTVSMSGAPVEFDFSSEWDGLGKTAVFTCDGTKDVILDAEGKAVVPHEILTTPGMDVVVGVYAVREDGTTWPAPTPLCRIGRVETGADPSGDESYPPTPDVGEQAVAAASKALEAAAEAQEVAADIQRRADAGEFDGAQGEKGEKGDKGDKGEKGDPGTGAVELDPTLTQSGKAADAKAVGDALANVGNPTDEQVSAAVTDYLTEHPVSGLSDTEKTLLMSLLNNAIYTTDMTEALAQLEAYWNGSGGSGGESGGGDTGGGEDTGGDGSGGDTPPVVETLPSWIAEMQIVEFTPEADTNEAQTFTISMENEPNMVFVNSDIEAKIDLRDFVSAVCMKDTVGGTISRVNFYSAATGIMANTDFPTDCSISANEVILSTNTLGSQKCYWRAGHTYKVYCVKTVCDSSGMTPVPSFAKETYALTFTPEAKTNEAQTFSYEMENEPNAVLIFTDYTGDGSARDFYGAFCRYSSGNAAWRQNEITRASSAVSHEGISSGYGIMSRADGSLVFQTDVYGGTCEYWLPDRTYYIILMAL